MGSTKRSGKGGRRTRQRTRARSQALSKPSPRTSEVPKEDATRTASPELAAPFRPPETPTPPPAVVSLGDEAESDETDASEQGCDSGASPSDEGSNLAFDGGPDSVPLDVWPDSSPISMGQYQPTRWRIWALRAVALATIAAGLAFLGTRIGLRSSQVGARLALAERVRAEAEKSPEADQAPLDPAERADESFQRDRHTGIRGGVVFVPDTFSSEDGEYDLLLHFHGNTGVVTESVDVVGLSAIVAIVNLGVGSAPYEEAYAMPGTYEKLLEQINSAIESRGLAAPHLRRLALSSWSAGYGAVQTILHLRKGDDPLDAVLILDGIHCGYDEHNDLNALQLAPWVDAAQSAARGEILFTITHTDIRPSGYASAKQTATYLLNKAGGTAFPRYSNEQTYLRLPAGEGAMARAVEQRMDLKSEGRVGDFHVRGYFGRTPEHHMAHLLQMATTVLPELNRRWTAPPTP